MKKDYRYSWWSKILRVSLKISHYGYVLENGRIVLEGNGDSLLNNEYTKKAYLGMV